MCLDVTSDAITTRFVLQGQAERQQSKSFARVKARSPSKRRSRHGISESDGANSFSLGDLPIAPALTAVSFAMRKRRTLAPRLCIAPRFVKIPVLLIIIFL